MRVRTIAAIGLAAACVLLLCAGVAPAQTALASHPILGTWKLNPAKSTVALTVTLTTNRDGSMRIAVQGDDRTFRIDGKDYPGLFGSVFAWTAAGPRAWNVVNKMNGKVESIDRYVLSADERVLTLTGEPQPPAPRGDKREIVFQRVSGGPGLAGVWRSTSATAGEATAEYRVEGNNLTVSLQPTGERWSGPLDGRDYPLAPGASVPDGMTWAGRQSGARTISFVLKVKGGPVQFTTLTVAPDGKTLEILQVNGATENAPDRNRLIYERQ